MEEFRPIFLLVVAIDSEVLFQSLISFIWFVHHLRMISGSEVKLHVQCSSEGPEEVGYEFHTMIGSDVAWDTMLGKEV